MTSQIMSKSKCSITLGDVWRDSLVAVQLSAEVVSSSKEETSPGATRLTCFTLVVKHKLVLLLNLHTKMALEGFA